MNQCDGCNAGLMLVGGMHVDKDGSLFMICQRSRYTEAVKKMMHKSRESLRRK